MKHTLIDDHEDFSHFDVPICYRVYMYLLDKLYLLSFCIKRGNKKLKKMNDKIL